MTIADKIKTSLKPEGDGRKEALKGMIGQGRIAVEDLNNLDTKLDQLDEFKDGDMPMLNNAYYRYNSSVNVLPIVAKSERSVTVPSIKESVKAPSVKPDEEDLIFQAILQRIRDDGYDPKSLTY